MNPLRLLIPFLLYPVLQSHSEVVEHLDWESHGALPVLETDAPATDFAPSAAEAPAAEAPAAGPAAAVTDSDEDLFSFGKVVAVQAQCVTVREYDFEHAGELDVCYWITGATELGNLASLADLAVGDDVVIDYVEVDDTRAATSLVKEMRDPDDGLERAIGSVVAVEAGAITVRQYDAERECETEVRYVVTGGTELSNLGSLGDLALGDEIAIEFVEMDGFAGATSLTKIGAEDAPTENGTAGKRCLPCVVTSADRDEIQLRITDGTRAADAPGACELDPEVILVNLRSLKDLREGDRVGVMVERIEGKWTVVGVARVDGP